MTNFDHLFDFFIRFLVLHIAIISSFSNSLSVRSMFFAEEEGLCGVIYWKLMCLDGSLVEAVIRGGIRYD